MFASSIFTLRMRFSSDIFPSSDQAVSMDARRSESTTSPDSFSGSSTIASISVPLSISSILCSWRIVSFFVIIPTCPLGSSRRTRDWFASITTPFRLCPYL